LAEKKLAMKPRIKFDASDNKRSRMTYYVQVQMMQGITGICNINEITALADSKIAAEIQEMLKKILEIPGVSKLEVQNTELEVIKIVAAEWQDDGIHQKVIDILKGLYPGSEVEVVPVEDGDFPTEAGDEDQDPAEILGMDGAIIEMLSGLLGEGGDMVKSVEVNFRINFSE
jgi:hypothetical protein